MKKAVLLFGIIKPYLDKEGELAWVEKKLSALQGDFKPRTLYLAFSSCSRFIEKRVISFSEDHLEEIQGVYPNFAAQSWSKDELVRILFMCYIPVEENQKILDTLFATSDIRESIALYKGLYFLENAESFSDRAREGLRTNMSSVFDAIALHNPFPFEYLDEDAWNHMVLKAMFMVRPLYKVYKIEARKNKKLALIFLDYAHERWSAHRKVNPELWRFVSTFADEQFFEDIKKTIKGGDSLEAKAATKALFESAFPTGQEWLQKEGISTSQLPSWDEIGKEFELELEG